MSIKHTEIEIKTGEPFANCKLNRKQYANILTDLVNSYSNGFVLAINNKWGTGKTTFVKMWRQHLEDMEFQTVYFNAWENDFENNALTALMGELKTLTKKPTETKFKNVLQKAAILSKHIAPIITKAMADKYVNTEGFKESIVEITKGLTDIFENDVNEYSKKKKNISEFKQSLHEFIIKTNKDKPIIFIIDELDRCRPDYAVSILEQIKHFFSVPNIVFVLSIDKIQLGNAIRGVYGSDKIDADEYLRRFIDIEYSIPEPENNTFYKYLYDYFNFKDFFNSSQRKQYYELQSDEENFLGICKLLFTNNSITLRQQEKIFALSRISLRTFNQNSYVFPYVYLFLSYIKVIKPNFYDDLKYKRLSLLQFQQTFFEIVKHSKNKENEMDLIWLEIYLLTFYNNFLNSLRNKKELYELDRQTGKIKLNLNSIINGETDIEFLKMLQSFNEQRHGDFKLDYFLNKIDLLEELKF